MLQRAASNVSDKARSKPKVGENNYDQSFRVQISLVTSTPLQICRR